MPAVFDLTRAEWRESKARQAFERVRRAEHGYGLQLRKIARHVGDIIRAFPPGDPASAGPIGSALQQYAELITPWAQATSRTMLAEVGRRDEQVWGEIAKTMNRALKDEIRRAPTGEIMRRLLGEQVQLIRSIPLDAAQRVHDLTTEAIANGTRADHIAAEIVRSGEVSVSRANLIAVTEVGRTSSALTQARATFVGSEEYVWRTSKDRRVRPEHRALEGKTIRWDRPPVAGSNGERYHAGAGPRCRCYAEPVIPDRFD